MMHLWCELGQCTFKRETIKKLKETGEELCKFCNEFSLSGRGDVYPRK